MAQTYSGDFEQDDRSRGHHESEGLSSGRPDGFLSERAFCDPRGSVGINLRAAIALTRQGGRPVMSRILCDEPKLVRILIVLPDVGVLRPGADLKSKPCLAGM